MISIFNFNNRAQEETGIVICNPDTRLIPIENPIIDKIVGAKVEGTVVGVYRRVYWNA